MRISFDLDDTLICYQKDVPRETPLPWYWRLLVGDEPLRLGTRSVIQQLQQQGWEVWIYTTSHRGPRNVRYWLRCHGIRVIDVVNQDVHDTHLKRKPSDYPPSKHPAAFGIDLHVDDSDGVRMEGEKHGFNVVVVSPGDLQWAQKVLSAADRMTRFSSNRVG